MRIDRSKLQLFFMNNIIWVLCIAIFIAFSFVVERGWFALDNLEFIMYTSSFVGFLVLGEALVLINGNLDLSLAQNAGLSASVIALLSAVWGINLPGWSWIIIIVLIGAGLGAINGLFVGKFGMNAFLVTLGTFLVYDWATLLIHRGPITGLPEAFLQPGTYEIAGFHVSILILLAAIGLLYFVLTRTRLGSNIYSVGGKVESARNMGINIGKNYFIVFTIAGALAGISGLIYVGYLQAVTSTIAEGQIFMAFAGAIIGGVSLKGGRGGVVGAFGGILLLGIIEAGFTYIRIEPALRGVLNGIVLLIAIGINRVRERVRDEILMEGS